MEKSVQTDFFRKQKWGFLLLAALLLAIYFGAAGYMEFDLWRSLPAIPESFVWLFKNFVPTETSLAYLPLIAEKLLETILMAVAATMSATVMAFLVAVLGSREIGLNPLTKAFGRIVASFFRTIPIVVWGMILLLSFKQSELTGYLAITFTTFGYLTRSFMETIDEVAGSTIEALKATGATYFQIIFQGVLPMAAGQLISWVLFLIENNIRDATLVGILTGTGIGFLFDMYYKKFQYDVVGLITLLIVIGVVLLELISNQLRRVIL